MNRLSHACEIVLPGHGFHAEPPIIGTIPAGPRLKLTIDATANVPLIFECRSPRSAPAVLATERAREFNQVFFWVNCHRQGVGKRARSDSCVGSSSANRPARPESEQPFHNPAQRRFFHFAFELRLQLFALSLEKFARPPSLDRDTVRASRCQCTCGAEFQVGVKTMTIIRFRRSQWAASAQIEFLADHRDCAAQGGRMRKRPK